jgi:hypothetical protein
MGARQLSAVPTALSILTSGAPTGDAQYREVVITVRNAYKTDCYRELVIEKRTAGWSKKH